jgi:ubiquinone/menaquinone biosynthesis C-methylase UbiE
MTHPVSADDARTAAYYDEFSAEYERQRGPNDQGGYHELVDDLEVDFAGRFAEGRDLLEVGCGTGLLLARLAKIARSAQGIDLSPGMLKKAEARGLSVREGSVTDLPYPDGSFDVTCSFKVLAHVPCVERALAEMVRVTRPQGVVIAEFYNPMSLRGLVKRLGPAGAISRKTKESEVFTRFDPPWKIGSLLPPGSRIIARRGVRIVTPAAVAMRIPIVGRALRAAERALCDSTLAVFGGFYIAAVTSR